MKKYFILAVVLVFLACGGGKVAVEEETVSYPEQSKPVSAQSQPRMVSPDSIALLFAKSQSPRKEPEVVINQKENIQEMPRELPGAQPAIVTVSSTAESVNSVAEQSIAPPTPQPVPDQSQPEAIRMKRVEQAVVMAEIPTESVNLSVQKRQALSETDICNTIVLDDIFFDWNQWKTPGLTFNSNYFITLGKIAKALRKDDNITVRLYGHTDPDGSHQQNLVISEMRCATVGKMITNLFNDSDRNFIAARIELIPVGEVEPLVEGSSELQEVLNRRVAIKITRGPVEEYSLADYLSMGSRYKTTRQPASGSARQTTGSKNPAELYTAAGKLVEVGNYAVAIEIYQEILAMDSSHKLADNAQWWIGDCYYHQNQFQQAIEAYKKVFGLGDGNKEAYAQLRLGHCYARMGQYDRAIEELGRVSTKYPEATEEIGKAKLMISELQNKYFK